MNFIKGTLFGQVSAHQKTPPSSSNSPIDSSVKPPNTPSVNLLCAVNDSTSPPLSPPSEAADIDPTYPIVLLSSETPPRATGLIESTRYPLNDNLGGKYTPYAVSSGDIFLPESLDFAEREPIDEHYGIKLGGKGEIRLGGRDYKASAGAASDYERSNRNGVEAVEDCFNSSGVWGASSPSQKGIGSLDPFALSYERYLTEQARRLRGEEAKKGRGFLQDAEVEGGRGGYRGGTNQGGRFKSDEERSGGVSGNDHILFGRGRNSRKKERGGGGGSHDEAEEDEMPDTTAADDDKNNDDSTRGLKDESSPSNPEFRSFFNIPPREAPPPFRNHRFHPGARRGGFSRHGSGSGEESRARGNPLEDGGPLSQSDRAHDGKKGGVSRPPQPRDKDDNLPDKETDGFTAEASIFNSYGAPTDDEDDAIASIKGSSSRSSLADEDFLSGPLGKAGNLYDLDEADLQGDENDGNNDNFLAEHFLWGADDEEDDVKLPCENFRTDPEGDQMEMGDGRGNAAEKPSPQGRNRRDRSGFFSFREGKGGGVGRDEGLSSRIRGFERRDPPPSRHGNGRRQYDAQDGRGDETTEDSPLGQQEEHLLEDKIEEERKKLWEQQNQQRFSLRNFFNFDFDKKGRGFFPFGSFDNFPSFPYSPPRGRAGFGGETQGKMGGSSGSFTPGRSNNGGGYDRKYPKNGKKNSQAEGDEGGVDDSNRLGDRRKNLQPKTPSYKGNEEDEDNLCEFGEDDNFDEDLRYPRYEDPEAEKDFEEDKEEEEEEEDDDDDDDVRKIEVSKHFL